MTNKEKREYFSLMTLARAQCFSAEIIRLNNISCKTPKKLYKYRKFDKYAFEMIRNNYAYLAPAGELDDPFDCLVNTSFDEIYEGNTFNLSKRMMEFIVDIVLRTPHEDKFNKEEILQLIDDCTVNGKIDNKILESQLDNKITLTNEQKDYILNGFVNFDPVLTTLVNDTGMKQFILNLVKSSETVGVCSLSTKRDNKVMWSHYSRKYKGYCIEYEITQNSKLIHSLLPVVYDRNFDNNISKKVVEFVLENIKRQISSGQLKTNIGVFDELLCTKDTDWSYQDEWRIIGDAKAHCHLLKIKNVFLGFDVSKTNEEKMIKYAKKYNFGLYKMNKPTGLKKIVYTKLKVKGV